MKTKIPKPPVKLLVFPSCSVVLPEPEPDFSAQPPTPTSELSLQNLPTLLLDSCKQDEEAEVEEEEEDDKPLRKPRRKIIAKTKDEYKHAYRERKNEAMRQIRARQKQEAEDLKSEYARLKRENQELRSIVHIQNQELALLRAHAPLETIDHRLFDPILNPPPQLPPPVFAPMQADSENEEEKEKLDLDVFQKNLFGNE